jgi:hypothetical protein
MRMTRVIPSLALASALASASALAAAPQAPISRPGAEAYVQQAFTLDEMNCFSSDLQAREAEASTDDGQLRDELEIARESGGGTNGIPCKRRGSKPPPPRTRS